VATIALTVLLSVVAHGLSAKPFAGRFTTQAEPLASNSGRASTRARSDRDADRELRYPGDGPDK
jgi:hypothetical protein